ncbi:MAG: hypothetical protein GY851_08195 [bacterium]|nr:hypothetical protein [bacterium]
MQWASCENNLRQMGIVFQMYVYDSQGGPLPSLCSESGRLMMRPDVMYPDYVTDPEILLCVDHNEDNFLWWEANRDEPSAVWIDDQSYFYLGYDVANDDEMRAFAEAYRRRVSEGMSFGDDLPVPTGRGSQGGDALLRLRFPSQDLPPGQGDEGLAGPEALRASKTVTLIERLGNHESPGGNVLFLDGHTEFRPYPGEWPMTETTMTILAELDALGPPVPTVEEDGAKFSLLMWAPRMSRAFLPFFVIGLVLGLVIILSARVMGGSNGNQA